MKGTYINATIYARCAPRPLVGDEHYPNGCAGISFAPRLALGQLTAEEARGIAHDFERLADAMERKEL